MNITDKWTENKGITGRIIVKLEYTVNGVTYKVDGKHVVLNPTNQEIKIAVILSEKYGKTVELVPQVMFPQGVQTPDYMIDGDRFDLKTPTGKGKNVIYGMLAKKKKQSPNFILDITDCPLSESEIEAQINNIYSSVHTKFVEKIAVMKDKKILKVYNSE